MFVETGYRRVGAFGSSWGGASLPSFPTMDVRSYNSSVAEEDHQRAAMEFVNELAGSCTVPVTEKIIGCQSYVYADEVPVSMFTVDLDMRCVLWNKRAADLTGWTESEIFAMPSFYNTLFSNLSSPRRDTMEDVLKGALDGHNDSQELWTLKTKWGDETKVLVVVSPRTDCKEVVTGAISVIVPTGAPPVIRRACKVDCAVSHLDLEEDQLSNDGDEDHFLAALEQPPSPYSERGISSIEMLATQRSIFADQVNMQSEGEGTSICSQDWCKSDQGSQVASGNAASGLEPSSLTRARVMVVDPQHRGRKSLTIMLERCGFEVACACSATDALWRFGESMHDPEGFSVIFLNLSVARADDYDLVRELRRVESGALLVAVTNHDRWDMSDMDGSKQQDLAAGVDAVITCPSKVQQLRDTLTNLGVSIDHLDFANKSPRAAFNSWSNPLVLAR